MPKRAPAGIWQVVMTGKKGSKVAGKIRVKSVHASTKTMAKKRALYWMGGAKGKLKVTDVKKIA